jgi:hypothetical protein
MTAQSSSIPRGAGYDLCPADPAQGERILATAITEMVIVRVERYERQRNRCVLKLLALNAAGQMGLSYIKRFQTSKD